MKETLFYNFTIGGRNTGYFELHSSAGELSMLVMFRPDNAEVYENRFKLKLDGDRVLAFKNGDNPWQTMPEGDDYFPTSAYPMLLKNLDGERRYMAIHEGNGSILGETILKKSGDRIDEIRDGAIARKFWLDNGSICKIDWGGAISELCRDEAEAKAGSGF